MIGPCGIAGIVRPATFADVPDVEACARAAYAKYVSRIGREPAPMVADFRGALKRGELHVIDDDEGLVGYIVLIAVGGVTLLENVAVRPEHAGRGFGRALIKFAEGEARGRDDVAVELYTNEKMTENVALYARLGYAETGRRREDGFDRVYFRKVLRVADAGGVPESV